MSKVLIIIQREFMTRVKKKSFIILTLLMPVIITGVVTVPAALAGIDGDESYTVGVVDKTGKYAPEFKPTENITFVIVHDNAPIDSITAGLRDGTAPFSQVVYIPADLTNASSGAATVFSSEETPKDVEREVNYILSEKIRHDRLSAYNLPNVEEIVKAADVDFSVKTVRKTDEGDKESNALLASVIGLMLSLFIYTFILSYGTMVMNSVVEEKTNRIVEIIVSSVKPWQLMAGKIAGIGLLGLFQMAIWATMLFGITTVAASVYGVTTMSAMPQMAGADAMGAAQMAQGPVVDILQALTAMDIVPIFVCFVLFFIGGYLLYAALFAAFGAAVNEVQDASQFTMPVVLIFIFALYAAMFSMENPNGPLAVWCSYIPLTSPIVMMVRMPFDVPLWSVLLSILLLYLTAAAVVLLSSKIYRIGILMYGQKPSFRELAKWLRY